MNINHQYIVTRPIAHTWFNKPRQPHADDALPSISQSNRNTQQAQGCNPATPMPTAIPALRPHSQERQVGLAKVKHNVDHPFHDTNIRQELADMIALGDKDRVFAFVQHLLEERQVEDPIAPAVENQWLTPTEAAEYAGLSKTTIWRWQKEGLASGRGGRVRRHDVNTWLAGTTGLDSNPDSTTEWLKLNQAAARAGVTRQTIWRWCHEGLKIQRRGRVVRIRSDVLDSYLKEGVGRFRPN